MLIGIRYDTGNDKKHVGSMTVGVRRLTKDHIIHAGLDESIGENINGPSMIKVPAWVKSPLAQYYLYFADHRGTFIRMAYADDLKGPWTVYVPGTLHLENSGFPAADSLSPKRRKTDPNHYAHIASPDLHILEDQKHLRMYFHGLNLDGSQSTRVAHSTDGIHFDAVDEVVGPAYLRAFSYGNVWYGIVMPGDLMMSPDGLEPFRKIAEVLPASSRHNAVLVSEDTLWIVWSEVGAAPERLYIGWLDLSSPLEKLVLADKQEILRPEREWEGAFESIYPSEYGPADSRVNQLRDPCLFAEGDNVYLLYTGGGECAIGLAELENLPRQA